MDRLTPPIGDRVGEAGAPPSAGLSEHRPPSATAPVAPIRRVATGLLVGALTMFGVATLDALAGAEVPVLGSFASLPAEPPAPEVVELPPPPADPGTCLMWARPDAADTAVVDCAQPHLFEQAGSVQLADQTTLPDDAGWRRLVEERCTPVVTGYLDGKFDPDGRFRIGALKPSPAKWEQGDRGLRCGLQSASRSGALYPTIGRVAEQDQSAVYEPGTCLGIDGRAIGDPVDCAGPHAVETVGIVDLSEEFPEGFPAVADQDEYLQPECTRIAGEYAGGAEVIEDKLLTVYWNNLTEASWAAGSRRVNCNLAALLPDRSGFAPVTGPVKGSVVVGERPAPPATATPEPGVPARPTTSPAPEPERRPAAEGGAPVEAPNVPVDPGVPLPGGGS